MPVVRRLGGSLPEASIGPRGHARATAGALMQGAPSRSRALRRVPWLVLAAAGSALAAVIVMATLLRSDGVGPAVSAVSTKPAPSEPLLPALPPAPRVTAPVPPDVTALGPPDVAAVEGSLLRDAVPVPLQSALPGDVVLHAAVDSRVTVYRVAVVIAATSDIRWASVERSMVLLRGRVEVDGDAWTRIATDRFHVEIYGAATITPDRVFVHRGSGRVMSPQRKLVAQLAQGASWAPQSSTTAARQPSVALLLDQAREAFTARDYARADQFAGSALEASPSRAQEAEARMIMAECAHARGRLDDALARYEAIAAQFADLSTGEMALFSAARLQASRGDADAARVLFHRYLDRFPSGRFAVDAERELRKSR